MRLHPFEEGKNPMLVLLKMALTVYLGVVVLLWLGQEIVLFPGMMLYGDETLDSVDWAEHVEANGAHYLLANPEHDRIVLMAHGNGMWAGQLEPYARVLDRLGWSFAAIEFRGYADVPGWPRESALRTDLDTMLTDLESRGYPLDRTVLHGNSIGGGVIGTGIARGPAGVVLESTFDSLAGVVGDRLVGKLVPVSLLLRTPFRTGDALRAHPVPAFRVHDTTDHVVGFSNAITGDTVEELQTTGYPHGSALVLADRPTREAWAAWLEKRCPR